MLALSPGIRTIRQWSIGMTSRIGIKVNTIGPRHTLGSLCSSGKGSVLLAERVSRECNPLIGGEKESESLLDSQAGMPLSANRKMYELMPDDVNLNPEGKKLKVIIHKGRPIQYYGVRPVPSANIILVKVGHDIICRLRPRHYEKGARIHDIYTTILQERGEVSRRIRTNWEAYGLPRPSESDDSRWIEEAVNWLKVTNNRRRNACGYNGVLFGAGQFKQGWINHWTARYMVNCKQYCLGYYTTALKAALSLDEAVRGSSELSKARKLKLINFKRESDYLTEEEVLEINKTGGRITGVIYHIKTKKGSDKSIVSYSFKLRGRCFKYVKRISGSFTSLIDAVRACDVKRMQAWEIMGEKDKPYPPTIFSPSQYGYRLQEPPVA